MLAFIHAFDALLEGNFRGVAQGRRNVVSKTRQVGGRSFKLVAEELGGSDYISLNLYVTKTGAALRPCEMAEAKVVDFVLALVPDQ